MSDAHRTATVEPELAEPVSDTTAPPLRDKRNTLLLASLWALTGLPIFLAIAEAIRSPRLNFNDFWLVLGMTTTADGAFDVSKITKLFQDQPVELISAVYWLDAKFFAGANWTLGLFSVLLALTILGAMWAMLQPRFNGPMRVALLAGLSALVFSSAAFSYFGIGMMGAWWLLGLAPAVVATSFAHHGKTTPAVVFGILASLGHGSALPVWLAIVLVAWLRRDKWWRLVLPSAFGLLFMVLWALAPGGISPQRPNLVGADTLLATMLATIGKVWSSESTDLAILTGALMLGILLALIPSALKEHHRTTVDPDMTTMPDAGWFGLATHMVVAAAMIGVSRGGFGTIEGLAPRYVGLTLLFACALLVLVISRGPALVQARAVPIVIVVALATYGIGSANATETRRQYPNTPTLAVVMRLDARYVISKHYGYPDHMQVLRSMKVYPFTDDFTLGCGGPELGSWIDLATVEDLPAPGDQNTTVGYIETSTGVIGDAEISGWAMINGQQAQCVLVVDQTGTVVGGGSVGLPRKDILATGIAWGTGRSGWQAVARPGTQAGWVLLRHGSTFYRLTAENKPRS